MVLKNIHILKGTDICKVDAQTLGFSNGPNDVNHWQSTTFLLLFLLLLLLLLLLRTSIGLVHTHAALLSLVHLRQTRKVNSLKTIILTKMSRLPHQVNILSRQSLQVNISCPKQSRKVKVLLNGQTRVGKCLKTFNPANMSTPNCFPLNYLDISPLVFAVSAIHCLLIEACTYLLRNSGTPKSLFNQHN